MAVKMRKWSATPTRNFHVAVKLLKLHGFLQDGSCDEITQKFIAIAIKWKGEPKFFPFQSRPKKEISGDKLILREGEGIVQWDDNRTFENTCCFSLVSSSNHHHPKFGAWEIAFNVLYGEKTKMAVIGRASANLAEIACTTENTFVEHKLPLSLQIDGFSRNATLTVLFNFVEIREAQGFGASPRVSGESVNMKSRRRSLSQEEVSLDESDAFRTDKTEGWFSWKSRRFNFKRAKNKEEEISNEAQIALSSSSAGVWEEKEVTSRDGEAKLRTSVFFASFDQCSDKAAGESACTALVAVISHWLHSNTGDMPNQSELENLIVQGSSEWRKLCEDECLVKDFPNKHFDLETVLRADIRPISISHNKSFVGFFGAEAFESLKGVMSFDEIWDEICKESWGIYTVSWNDHFFVLKADANGYYMIDTLGERLLEGCKQAFILRFDEKTVMEKDGEVVCNGKECCREFIKRFLAAIPFKELEEEKNSVSYLSLHQRLQIEFNYTSLTSSPLSTSTASSPFSD